tara:strand:+ start:523 stop:1011 length:489 start_codon:yes stop_codon:yes gene_type:complete
MILERLNEVKLALFDFDGVFTNNLVYVSENGVEHVACCRSDGLGISRLNSIGIPTYVISTETNNVVRARCEKLKIPFVQNIKNKDFEVLKLCKELKIDLKNTLFIGNDINDIPALKIVGFPISVADSYPEIKEYTIYQTKAKGGEGAVREVCDLIYSSYKSF